MLTLQSTFAYDDGAGAPVEYADVLVQYPEFSLGQASGETTSSSLVFTGHGTTSFSQKLSSKTYALTIPTASIFGENYGTVLANYLSSLLRTNKAITPSDVSVSFSVRYGSEVSASSLDSLYFIKLLSPQVAQRASQGSSPSSQPTPSSDSSLQHPVVKLAESVLGPSIQTPGTTAQGGLPSGSANVFSQLLSELPIISQSATSTDGRPSADRSRLDPSMRGPVGANKIIDANIYLVNKTIYQDFIAHLFPGLAPDKESILLYLINPLVDLTGSLPILSQDSEASQRKAVQDILTSYGVSTDNNVYDYLKPNFSKLFDFPLKMPEFKLLTLAGTLGFHNPPPTVPFEDFVFFRMSAEYSIGPEESPTPIVSHYVWDKSKYEANHVGFSFTEDAIQNQILNPVIIRVKAHDQSNLYEAQFDAADPRLQNLNILIDIRLPPALSGSLPSDGSSNEKIRGKVVSLSKTCTLKGAIVIQAKKVLDGAWITVATGVSDKAGNFTTPYPVGQYVSAQALVSLDAGHPTVIPTDPQSTNHSVSSGFLYILIQDNTQDGKNGAGTSNPADGTKPTDCNCNPQAAAGRLPSQDDLIQSDQFMQDVGGGCVNLTVPNRSLREFSYTALIRNTDPDVASYTLSSFEDSQYNEVYRLTPRGKVRRNTIDLDNPVRWQDGSDARMDLTLYQQVTVSTGVILHYRSEFRADGYSLGDLVYSLPLAPGQKKQIVTVDATHSLLGTESQNVSQTEGLANSLINERNIIDQIGGNIGEALQGQSSASTSGISAGLGAGGSVGPISASLGVAGGYSSSNSNASQDSKRNISGYFNENLRQALLQNASDYRQLNVTAVTAVQEGQTYSAETDVVANHNHCHSMTMLYFEVLRHFAIYQDLVDAEECVFVPLLMTRFTIDNVGKWSDILASRLLRMPSNTFMKPAMYAGANLAHPLLSAFDALERYRTQWTLVDYPDTRYDEEVIREIQGTVDLRVSIPRPKTKYDFVMSFPITTVTVSKQVTDAKSIKDSFLDAVFSGGFSLFGDDGTRTVEEQIQQRVKILDSFISVDDNFQTVPPAQCTRVTTFKDFIVDGKTHSPMDFARVSPIDATMWQTYALILGYNDKETTAAEQLMEYYFAGQLISEWNSIFDTSVAPELYKALVQNIAIDAGSIELTTLNTYNGGTRNMRAYVNGLSSKRRMDIQYIKVYLNSSVPLALLPSPVSFDILSMRLTYATDHFNGLLFSGSIVGDLLEIVSGKSPVQSAGITVFAPESAAEKRNPRKDDVYLANRLLQHLNSNLEYYNRALWSSFDSNRTFMLLDGFQIETFDQYGSSEGYRSLASVLKNSLTAIVGNSLVFPCAPGYHVSQTLIVRRDSNDESGSLLDYYRPDLPSPPYRISVPTRGVYAEALMGQCDSCEDEKPSSSQDWTKFTTDQPTQINNVTPVVPTVSQYNPNIKDFATPMVQIQNAPNAPDPGAGLAGLTTLLGKPDVFKDITGLDGNQKNALQTFLSDQENAKSFAQMASSMVTQAHNTGNSSQIMDTIKKATSDGTLDKDSAKKLVTDHIQQSIDGGATMKANLERQRDQANPSLAGTATDAAKKGATVSASRTVTDGSGTVSESVDIKPESGASSGSGGMSDSVAVVGTIEPLKQADSRDCWATVATMMVSWLEKRSMSVEDVMRLAGDTYLEKYQGDTGLAASDKDDFLSALGMVGVGPSDHKPKDYIDWVRNYGPVWVTVDASASDGRFSPHAKLLIGVNSDDVDAGEGTTFIFMDPDPKAPAQSSQTFKDFEDSFQQAVTDNRSQQLYLQIVHFAEPINQPEGYEIEGPWNKGDPVHEYMTLSALMQSSFHLNPNSKLGQDQATNEFIRGVIWNDDPATLLFDDRKNDNWNFSSGLLWYINFKCKPSPSNITSRSHNGDLQFFHAMGTKKGEPAKESQAKIKLWVEIMYRLSIGQGLLPTDTIASVNISVVSPTTTYTLKKIMDPAQPPVDTQTLGYLLSRGTKYTNLDISRRALGSIMHTIQDSYARGHTRRTLLNPQDLVPGTKKFEFKPGTYGKWGPVENFHSYPTQDHKAHAAFDTFDKDKMHPNVVTSFDPLLGARDAIDRCTKLANFWNSKTPYENGPKALIENEVFALSPNASDSDDTV